MAVTHAQHWEKGNEKLVYNGDRVSGWDEEKVQKMDRADGCTIL